MNDKLIEVKAYWCNYCKKLFKIKRHFCWRDPENKACTTCYGWNDYETNYDENGDEFREATCRIVDRCINGDCITGEIDFGNHHNNRGYNCPYYINRNYANQLAIDNPEKLQELIDEMQEKWYKS